MTEHPKTNQMATPSNDVVLRQMIKLTKNLSAGQIASRLGELERDQASL